MGFLRVVEIFPPLFPSGSGEDRIHLDRGIKRFIEQAQDARRFADVLLIADIKNPKLVELSPLEAAAILKERARLEAAPVLVVRGLDRRRFLSSVLRGLSLELGYLMLAWGDDLPARGPSSNVRGFSSLAQAISQASLLRQRAKVPAKFLAPVNVELLASPGEVARARARLRAQAEYLLAQPPTTDPETLDRHAKLLREAGLEDRVLLNVFPFKDSEDARECEAYFGWRLPKSLHDTAQRGPRALFKAEREVVTAIRSLGFPGVYLNTRGTPTVAERLLS
jgi:hypothetical protein